MISTGNDIVALGSVNKQRANEARFYSKVLAASEQTLYQQPEFAEVLFENYLWLLWSVKESAYKYLKRILPDLIFSPVKTVVTKINIPLGKSTYADVIEWEGAENTKGFYSGTVVFDTYQLYFRSIVCDKWISTVVNDTEGFENVYWGTHSINDKNYKHQSEAVRSFAIGRLKAYIAGNLEINKTPAGYPVVFNDKKESPIPLSLAHHDHFVAYSFKLNSL
jgi:phosphopantetheinyl transferase (holo-ACP synthase)